MRNLTVALFAVVASLAILASTVSADTLPPESHLKDTYGRSCEVITAVAPLSGGKWLVIDETPALAFENNATIYRTSIFDSEDEALTWLKQLAAEFVTCGSIESNETEGTFTGA